MIKYELFLSDKRVERAKKTILKNELWKYKTGGILDSIKNKKIYGVILAKEQTNYYTNQLIRISTCQSPQLRETLKLKRTYHYVGCCFYTNHHYTLQTFVKPGYRRKGIGKQMLQKIRKTFPDIHFHVDDYYAANKLFYSHLERPTTYGH
jgi:GNAT superfamily N-acetyltransferase